MKHFGSIFFLLIFGHFVMNAQQVGIVLSGGGAKGVAHIGVLQALEDNGIPIDYITGTSIGAVVGGLYSMGYSPSDMMALIKSKEFDQWKTGTVDIRYHQFFRKPDPTPEILSTSVSLKDTVIDPRKLLPNSLLNPIQLNIVFMQLTAQATAYCKGDFNRLFVPFRSVAANIQDRKAHVFREGDLGEAIRASMTFPFVFKAIRVNDKLLYDGGIYDNYPVDIMKQDFDPDRMIGSIVDNVDDTPPDYDMYSQLQRMIMHPTVDSIQPGNGVQLKFDLSNVSLLSFDRADSVFRIGYEGAMAQMDSIKKMVYRRVDPFSLDMKRSMYKSRLPYLRFRQIEINGVTDLQRDYILRILKQDGSRYFSMEEFREGYFKLLTSSKIIKEIIPHALYDATDQSFKLVLDVDIDNSIDVAVGVNLSSALSNQLFLGLSYETLNELSQVYSGQLYVGRYHTGLSLTSQFNLAYKRTPKYLALHFSAHNFNYYQGAKLFYQSTLPAFMTQYESFLKVKYAIPVTNNGKLEVAFGGAFLMDSYLQEKPLEYSSDSYDRSIYGLGGFSVRLEQNTLNNLQFPTYGFRRYFLAHYLTGAESYRYPDSIGNLAKSDKYLAYFLGKMGVELYIPMKSNFILGIKSEGLWSNKRSLDNYTSSIIQAPAFTPTPHSKTVFNEAYRANQYLSVGVLPIWKLRSSLQWRTELYGFFPFKSLHEGPNHEVVTVRKLSEAQFLLETALVYNMSFANFSVYLNKYSAPSGNWNVGLNLGFLLFNKRFQE